MILGRFMVLYWFLGGGTKCKTCVTILFLTSEVTLPCVSDTYVTVSYRPLLLQSSIWILNPRFPHVSFGSSYVFNIVHGFLPSSWCLKSVLFVVFRKSVHFCLYMQTQLVLFVYSLSHVIYICVFCALLLTSQHSNQIVIRIISSHSLCLFKFPSLKMRMFLQITPVAIHSVWLETCFFFEGVGDGKA